VTDVRCPNLKHAELVGGVLEIKCRSRFCGAHRGAVVIHQFDPNTGKLLGTRQFRQPVLLEGVERT
jgi:hypothetical protein